MAVLVTVKSVFERVVGKNHLVKTLYLGTKGQCTDVHRASCSTWYAHALELDLVED